MSEEKLPLFKRPDDDPGELSATVVALMIGAFLAMLTLLYWLSRLIDVDALRVLVAGAGIWGPMIYVSIKALTFTFAPLSAGPIQFASGIVFGVIPGTFYSLLGEVIGGTISVVIARIFGRHVVRKLVGANGLARIDDFYERHMHDWQSLFMARVLLFSVYDFISYAVGLGNVRVSTYIIISFAGGWAPTYIFVKLGAETAENEQILFAVYVIAALAFVAFIIFRRPIEQIYQRYFT